MSARSLRLRVHTTDTSDTKTTELTKDAKSLKYGKVRGSGRAERFLGIDCLFARLADGGGRQFGERSAF